MLMEPIYEETFWSSSYGFRPGRSAHDALDAVCEGTFRDRLCWVIDCDISQYFDTIRFDHLRDLLDLRIKDGVIRRMLDKWLKAGVLDKGVLTRSETGVPQGGVVSPLLSNVFLHHVLDEWFETVVTPRMQGQCRLVRYADDALFLFETERDARRVLDVLGQAAWPVRAHAPPDQDPVRRLPAETPPEPQRRRDIRLPRLHPRLGEVTEGIPDCPPSHGQGAVRAGGQVRLGLVPT